MANDQTAKTVEPIVEIDGDAIAACGVRAKFEPGPSISFTLERIGKNADFVVRYSFAGSKSGSFRLDDDPQFLPDLRQGQAFEDGLELRVPARDPNVAIFLQRLMLQGVMVRAGDSFEQKFEIRGPLPQSVRAAYLNCAGDLYRPGE